MRPVGLESVEVGEGEDKMYVAVGCAGCSGLVEDEARL